MSKLTFGEDEPEEEKQCSNCEQMFPESKIKTYNGLEYCPSCLREQKKIDKPQKVVSVPAPVQDVTTTILPALKDFIKDSIAILSDRNKDIIDLNNRIVELETKSQQPVHLQPINDDKLEEELKNVKEQLSSAETIIVAKEKEIEALKHYVSEIGESAMIWMGKYAKNRWKKANNTEQDKLNQYRDKARIARANGNEEEAEKYENEYNRLSLLKEGIGDKEDA